jgi:hypothetical protein
VGLAHCDGILVNALATAIRARARAGLILPT